MARPTPPKRRVVSRDGASLSGVRIESGTLRGRMLHPPRVPGLRPTGSMLRQAVFNRLRSQGREGGFLDLFSGSGVMGLTALSEGYAPVFLCEQEAVARQALEGSLREFAQGCSVLSDFRQLACQLLDGPWVAYLDPPFAQPELAVEALHMLRSLAFYGESLALLECERDVLLPPGTGWDQRWVRCFGRSALHELLPE